MGVKRTFLQIKQNYITFLLKVDNCSFSKATFLKNSLIELLSVEISKTFSFELFEHF